MACMMLQLDVIADRLDHDVLERCSKLKENLHQRSTDILMAHEEVGAAYYFKVKDKIGQRT